MLDGTRLPAFVRAGLRILIGLAVLVEAGCGGDAADSRGTDTAPVWSLEPTFEIGSLEDSEESLTSVGGVVLSEDGELYVAQPQDGNIRVHDAAGELARTLGQRGEGPGELAFVSAMGLRNGELWVVDPTNRRITFFTPQGELLRTRRWLVPPIGTGAVRHMPSFPAGMTLREDGSAVVIPSTATAARPRGSGGGPGPSPEERIPPIVLVGPENTILDTVAMADHRTDDPLGEGQRSLVRNEPLYTLHPGSGGVVFVRRATVGNPEPGTFRVGHVGPEGDTVFSRAYGYSAMPTPPELVREYLEPLPEDRRDEIWVPQTLPPVSDRMVGSDGVIWIAREAEAQDSVAWSALDPETGDPLGTLHLPPDHQILESRDDLIVVHRTDEFDVPYLLGYRLTR